MFFLYYCKLYKNLIKFIIEQLQPYFRKERERIYRERIPHFPQNFEALLFCFGTTAKNENE